jgi:maleylpyruvate isomerase
MDERERALAGVLAAHRTLAARLDGLTDEHARQPSQLPAWSVGHVVTHIARNADGLRTMLEGAMRGESVAMYPGGLQQRATDIEAGADRPAAELRADLAAANDRLEAAFAAMTDDAWAGSGTAPFGPVAMREVPTRRRTEVEVHHVDLGLGYRWADWPSEFVRVEIQRLTMVWNSRRPMGLTGLPEAALAVDEHHRAAWLLGRADIDGLEPARLMG